MGDGDRPSTPFWWYGLVALALVFAVMWVISAVVGFVFSIIRLAVLVILAVALIGWVVNKKAAR